MDLRRAPRHDLPLQLNLKGRNVVLRRLAADDRDAIVAFARALPKDDLLFLDRDMTQTAEVEAWINQSREDRCVAVVACEGETIVGYATYDRGVVRWRRHVAELRVAVAESARGLGIGRLVLELAFELVLDLGVTKIIARMTPNQTGAKQLFKRLGFEEEALLRDHALGEDGRTHDLLVLSFRARLHPEQRCECCGIPVLDALSVDGSRLCSSCYEDRYQELGGG